MIIEFHFVAQAIVGAATSRPRGTGFRIGMHPGEFLQRFDLNVGEARSLPPGLSTECPVEWYNARRGTHFAQHELSLWAGTAREDTILPYSFVQVLWEFAQPGSSFLACTPRAAGSRPYGGVYHFIATPFTAWVRR